MVFGYQNILVVFAHSEEISPFSEHSLEKTISIKTNDLIEQLSRNALYFERAVITGRRKEFFLASNNLHLVLLT